MPNESLIIVGAGGISAAWMPAIKAEELGVGAVVDIKLEAARGLIDKHELKNAKASGDLDDVLTETKADFLLDLTIPGAHCDVTCKAMRSGLHVIGEKPMAATMEQARRMLRTSEETGKLYMVSQSRRWESLNQSVAATIRSGALGELTTVNCDFFIAPHFGGFRDEMPSPLILDMAIHHFDMARLFTGQNAAHVYAEEYNPKGSWYKGSPAANCLFELTDGTRFNYRGSWCAEGCYTPWSGNWRFVGDKGTLLFESDRLAGEVRAGTEGFHHPRAPLAISSVAVEHTTMRGALREMLRFLRTGQKPQTECHDNIHSLAMVHAAIESSRSGKRVSVSGV